MANETKKQVIKTEQATESDTTKQVREQTKAIVEELLPAMMAAQRANQPLSVARPGRNTTKCPTCRQLMSACGSKHTKMVVYPKKYPEFAEWFQGVQINGVTYLSNGVNHEVLVPECAVGSITTILNTFEENERDTRIGKKKHRNSGTTDNMQPATPSDGWR